MISKLYQYLKKLNAKLYYLKCKKLNELSYPKELKKWYKRRTGQELDLNNPKSYNEKLQWIKLYDRDPLKTKLADKYLVREWVKEKIGEHYLIPLLGVWDNPDGIDFDLLPQKFVLKANHGCKWNIIVEDKDSLNIRKTKRKLKQWLKTNYAYCAGFELLYKDIKPRVIAEEFIENEGDLYDYKIWCFHGKPHYIMFLSDRKQGLKMNFYDTRWNLQPFRYSYPGTQHMVKKPDNLDEMLHLAEVLAQGFPHVRVDFYRLNDGSLKFGEMTFTSYSGVCRWNPEEQNMHFGNLIKLPC